MLLMYVGVVAAVSGVAALCRFFHAVSIRLSHCRHSLPDHPPPWSSRTVSSGGAAACQRSASPGRLLRQTHAVVGNRMCAVKSRPISGSKAISCTLP